MNRSAPRRPSLRRRLLVFLLIPMIALLMFDAVLSYGVALTYANRVHDRDLSDDAVTLAKLLDNDRLGSQLTPQARFLLEYDPDGRSYFNVRRGSGGLLAGNGQLPQPAHAPALGAAPTLYDTRLDQHTLRAATVHVAARHAAGDSLIVTVAETLHDRREQAREILLLAVLMQTFLIVCLLALVWFGVTRGLRVLDPLTAQLAGRSLELTPIDGADVPQEIQPLTRTIDALFGRLRSMLDLHDRFIADAAHQLRTPLTGLSLHVERALADPRPETVADALGHIQRLTHRAARTSSQLLALMRAQTAPGDPGESRLLDLARLIPEAVTQRVHEAIRAGVDLGYAGSAQPLHVLGDAAGVQDMLDNLIDNAMRYAGRGSNITVQLQAREDGGATLSVEDDGPGVPSELMSRLSERFFRVAGGNEAGSGLGLAIVQSIARRHHAEVVYQAGSGQRGLRVEIRFPPATRGRAST
ncbi:sensor histidine kinase [Rhodanobacter umsongensis]|uniref:histidine kinase n=1 Tax=Rhodanobacter umsongensis TaxID=633153 RepID=A0ABW0JIL7_9GAMM